MEPGAAVRRGRRFLVHGPENLIRRYGVGEYEPAELQQNRVFVRRGGVPRALPILFMFSGHAGQVVLSPPRMAQADTMLIVSVFPVLVCFFVD